MNKVVLYTVSISLEECTTERINGVLGEFRDFLWSDPVESKIAWRCKLAGIDVHYHVTADVIGSLWTAVLERDKDLPAFVFTDSDSP